MAIDQPTCPGCVTRQAALDGYDKMVYGLTQRAARAELRCRELERLKDQTGTEPMAGPCSGQRAMIDD